MALSTNIINRGTKDDEWYPEIGKTRLEPSGGRPMEGCNVNGLPNPGPKDVGALSTEYRVKGHHQLQYIKRLENVVDTSVLPNGNRGGFRKSELL